MPRLSTAKTQLIKTARSLFRRRGYHAVGLTEILEASGAPKGSFYHHFPRGKEALAEAAVQAASDDMTALIHSAFAEARTLEEGVDALVDALAVYFSKSCFEAGCPITSVLLDMTPQSERMVEIGQAAFRDWGRALIAEAERLGETRDIRAASRALLVALEGGWIIARIEQDTGPILQSKHIFRAVLADPA